MSMEDKEFIGIVGREIVIRDKASGFNESFPYIGKMFSTENDSLLMFYVNNESYYIWQKCMGNKIKNIFYNYEQCRALILRNIDNILANKAMQE